ncbi:hypothetical protein [Vibrio mediterranei]|uniref:hypothetical protein n=1 Tax=Vibrio mediterranei TaxID=689 RepID=UPI0040690D7B
MQDFIELFGVTGIAAFIGVWAAVELENRRRSKLENSNLLKEYSFVFLHLKAQQGTLLTISHYLDDYKDDPNRHLTMLPTSIATQIEYLQPREFSFLLLENNALAIDLSTFQNFFSQLVRDFQQRNEAHYQWQKDQGCPRLTNQLRDRTDHLYVHKNELVIALGTLLTDLGAFSEAKFKDVRYKDIEIGTFEDRFFDNKQA